MKYPAIFALLFQSIVIFMIEANAAEPTRTVNAPEPGKCIFSTSVMPIGKFADPAYSSVSEKFTPNEKIAARCFYGSGAQKKYADFGSVANSMRDSGKYFYEFEWVRPPGVGGSYREVTLKTYNQNYNPNWDQQRLNMTPGFGECGVEFKGDQRRKYGADRNGCVDYVGLIKSQSRQFKFTPPKESKFCMRIYMKFANSHVFRDVGNSVVKEPAYTKKTMAEGCFTIDMSNEDMSTSSTPSADVRKTHAEALSYLDRFCQSKSDSSVAKCQCYVDSAIEQGIGEYSANAVAIWAWMRDPSLLSDNEREALFAKATADERAEGSSADINMFNSRIESSCNSLADSSLPNRKAESDKAANKVRQKAKESKREMVERLKKKKITKKLKGLGF